MKVKIKKEGKTKEYNLINSWEDVTLEKWVKLSSKERSTTKEAEETIAALSDIPKKLIKELSIKDVAVIMSKVAEEKKNKIYTIEAYDGNISIRAEEMKKMSAEQVESALRFFFAFVNELAEILPSYLMEKLTKMTEDLQMKALQKDGVGSE